MQVNKRCNWVCPIFLLDVKHIPKNFNLTFSESPDWQPAGTSIAQLILQGVEITQCKELHGGSLGWEVVCSLW